MAVTAPARATPWGSRVGGHGMWTWCPPRHWLSRFAMCGSRPGRYCTGDATCRNVPSTQHPGTRELLPLLLPLGCLQNTHPALPLLDLCEKLTLARRGSVERGAVGASCGAECGGRCLHRAHTSSFSRRGQGRGSVCTQREESLCLYRSKSQAQDCVSGKRGVGWRGLGRITAVMWPLSLGRDYGPGQQPYCAPSRSQFITPQGTGVGEERPVV